jgi:hypothetical protein
MAEYVALLEEAVEESADWNGRSPLEVLARAASRRTAYGRRVLFDGLDEELAYDRALIDVCNVMGISATPEGFLLRARERARLERALAELGGTWEELLT